MYRRDRGRGVVDRGRSMGGRLVGLCEVYRQDRGRSVWWWIEVGVWV